MKPRTDQRYKLQIHLATLACESRIIKGKIKAIGRKNRKRHVDTPLVERARATNRSRALTGKSLIGVKEIRRAKAARAAKPLPPQRNIDVQNSMRGHRKYVVKVEARAAHLANGFLKGRTYREMENNPKTEPPIKRTMELIWKYGAMGLFPEAVKAQRRRASEFRIAMHYWSARNYTTLPEAGIHGDPDREAGAAAMSATNAAGEGGT